MHFIVRDKGRQTACKPGSVHAAAHIWRRWTVIHLGRPLPDASCNLPGRRREHACQVPAEAGADTPSLFGFAPGGVYPATTVTSRAVRSYRTLSPLPTSQDRRFAFCGTFPGVAPAGRYPAPCLRGARTFLPPARRKAAIRPSGHPLSHDCDQAVKKTRCFPVK